MRELTKLIGDAYFHAAHALASLQSPLLLAIRLY